jgi:hypothetical protein
VAIGRRLRRDPAQEELWQIRIACLAASGLPTKHFYLQEGISEAALYAWKRELGRRDAERREAAAAARNGRRPAPGAQGGAAEFPSFFVSRDQRRLIGDSYFTASH